MKKLVIHGDPGIRKNAVIEYDDEEYVCFGVTRQGDYHGPDRLQIWCTVGSEDERETYQRREYIPMHLETMSADAEAIEVVESE
ncbi:hypothetical protein BRC83_05735 [Halobacteriales archaeon QS_1_68_17]|nr:MAG: hypothetical protein BRC83_05735 [Halobacteriales archaeon QS_1_68_17]